MGAPCRSSFILDADYILWLEILLVSVCQSRLQIKKKQIQMCTIDAIDCLTALKAWWPWQHESIDCLTALTDSLLWEFDSLGRLITNKAWMPTQPECLHQLNYQDSLNALTPWLSSQPGVYAWWIIVLTLLWGGWGVVMLGLKSSSMSHLWLGRV